MKKVVGIVAFVALLPATAFAGLGIKIPTAASTPSKPAGMSCDDDKGVEQAGKDMDEKAYNGLIGAETALMHVAEAAGKKDVAANAKANLDKWKEKEKAPSGLDRVKEVSKAAESIQKGADEVGKTKLDDKGKTAIVEARKELRMAVVYIAWAAKLGEPVPGNAKAAIEGSKACAAKVKGPVDAAAGVTSLLTNIKKTYTSVSDAAKKAGAPDMTDADKASQDSSIGAPTGAGV